MNGFISVLKREFKGYFTTPVAYVFLVIFLFLAGYATFEPGRGNFFLARQAYLRPFFANLPALFIFLIPAVAMRLWAEERRSGTIEVLLTLPLTVTQAVLGKFFAAWLFLAVGLFLTCPIIFTVSYLGDPDWGLIITGYLGTILMAGSYLSIGIFCSALTKNQVVGFILAVVACSVLVAAGSPPALDFLSRWVPGFFVDIFESLSFMNHFDSIQKGVLEFKDLLFYISIMCGWLIATVVLLQNRKAA